ncbi:MAG TPA: nuclear transport factor 2 family protein [Solirubrobacteraceae bacterium]|jgi:ketosteroid isomerase-like protein|nr:nuclear transport factor 2 family protein [Solirubrobacteraceae bacterium]
MSRGNVEVLLRGYDAFNTRDISRWLEGWHPDAELHDLPTLPDASVCRGHTELRTWIESILEGADYFRVVPERFIEADDFILVPVQASGAGSGTWLSGMTVEMRFVHVFEMRDGKIQCLRTYATEDEARKAAGVSE